MRLCALLAFLALASTACGGGSPTTPAAPATAAGAAIVSVTPRGFPALIMAGASAQLSLHVAFDNGAVETVTQGALWTSSDSDVATVDDHGMLTARGNGRVSISAAIKGASVSVPVGVVPDLSGTWAITMPAGDGRWTRLTFAEVSQQAAEIAGRWQWDSGVALDLEGSVNEKGAVTMSGRDCYSGNTYGYVLFKASDWIMAFDPSRGVFEGALTMSESGRYMGGPCSGWILRNEKPTVTELPVSVEVLR